VMFEATCGNELPNPLKGLTKLTKAPPDHPFVSFVSAFPHPQISETDGLPPRRAAKLSFTVNFLTAVSLAAGRAISTSFSVTLWTQMPEQLGLA
jgi:hypothetical protein